MEESTARKLRFLTLQVVGAVAVVHFVVGLSELARFARAGLLRQYFFGGRALAQPEPWLFVVSAVAIAVGVLATGYGYLGYRRAYALGIAIIAGYIVGWVGWHTVLDHGVAASDTAASAGGEQAHTGLLGVLISHYFEPMTGIFTDSDQPGRVTLAVISKTLEVVALALLTTLLALDPRVEDPENPIAELGESTAEE